MRRLRNALPGTPFESAPFFIAPWIFGSRAVGRAAVEFYSDRKRDHDRKRDFTRRPAIRQATRERLDD